LRRLFSVMHTEYAASGETLPCDEPGSDGRSGEQWNGCRAARVTRARAWMGPPRNRRRGCAGAASRRDAQPALSCRQLEEAGRPCRARGWKALCPSRLLRSALAGGSRRLPTGYAGRPRGVNRRRTVPRWRRRPRGPGPAPARACDGCRRWPRRGTSRAPRPPAWRRGWAVAGPPRRADTTDARR
jgi:hypothetical protein